MRLTILGATGGVGTELVKQAVARGHEVRVLVRREIPPTAGVEVWVGDVLDAQAVSDAVLGADAVVSALGSRRVHPANPWSRLAGPADLAERSARNVVEAMRAAGCSRLVAVSAAGVGDSQGALNGPMRFLLATSTIGRQYNDLDRMEAVYRASSLDWTAVRPVTLFDGPPSGAVRTLSGFPMTARIARADVAATLLDLVERPGGEPRTPILAGP